MVNHLRINKSNSFVRAGSAELESYLPKSLGKTVQRIQKALPDSQSQK